MKFPRANRFCKSVSAFLLTSLFVACGGGSYGGGGGGGGNPPGAPTGVVAFVGNQQVILNWNASTGATGYHVKRSTTNGGPYTQVGAPSVANYTDPNLTNGTAYSYVVSALNAYGESANSGQVSATPTVPVTNVSVNVDVLANRHAISPYVYGVNFPPDTAYITDTKTSLVRWGGNASSTYNWQLFTYNADNDYYFEDFNFGGLGGTPGDSAQFIKDVKTAGSHPLMTMVMLDWAAQTAENGANGHWSYSVLKYGSQCRTDPFNPDAGNGLKADCSTQLAANPSDAYFPLLDDHSQACPSGNCVYRVDWVTDPTKGLTQAFGGGSCPIPYFSNTSCHFYDMDNEIDIWGGTHVDLHPTQSGYNELRDTYLTQARKLKGWDPQAVRFGPVSCCWYFYWNLNHGSDNKASHANMDFLPWWTNEVYWNDQISGTRSLDAFDIHAYTDTSGSGLPLAQQQTLALNITRDWWDPNYTSQAWFGSNSVTTNQPLDSIPFRIPRVRAIANTNYPGTPVSFTEWNFAFAGEKDFSTALADVDAFGILGRERATYATRWTAADPTSPAYNSLKLYRNYDGSNGTFNPISVSATHSADPGLFSVYATTNVGGNSLMLMVVNKDPLNAAQVQFALNHFTPTQYTAYTLSTPSPNSIVAGSSQPWSSTITFAPYSATLLVVTGTTASVPAAEWDLNPDTVMVPAGGTFTLAPKLISGAGTETLGSPSPLSGGITVTTTGSTVTAGQQGSVLVTAGNTPGFYSFSVPATDSSGVSTTQNGWVLVTKPAATLTKTGDNQTGAVGTNLNLSVTFVPGQSGGTAAGASVFFTTSAGSLTNVQVGTEKVFAGTKVIAVTDSSGVAKVTLTLPATAQIVHVTAEGPYGLGHPVVTPFTETAR
jgi:Glycoside hydrolase family 44/Fibronectin type III domain